MNFFANGSLLCLIFCIYSLLKLNVRLVINSHSILEMLLTLVTCIVSIIYFDINNVIKCMIFFLIFITGYNYYNFATNKTEFIKNTIFSVFLGYFILILLTYIYNFNTGSFNGQRIILNVWTCEYVAVTLVGLLSSVVIGYSFYGLFVQKNFI